MGISDLATDRADVNARLAKVQLTSYNQEYRKRGDIKAPSFKGTAVETWECSGPANWLVSGNVRSLSPGGVLPV